MMRFFSDLGFAAVSVLLIAAILMGVMEAHVHPHIEADPAHIMHVLRQQSQQNLRHVEEVTW